MRISPFFVCLYLVLATVIGQEGSVLAQDKIRGSVPKTKFELIKKLHETREEGPEGLSLRKELERLEESESSVRTSYSSKVMIDGERCGRGNEDVDLRIPPGVMAHVEIKNQRNAGICSAAAASSLYDGIMKSVPDPRTQMPPMSTGRHSSPIFTFVSMNKDFKNGANFCDAFGVMLNEGGCEKAGIEEMYRVDDISNTSLRRPELKGADRFRYHEALEKLHFIEIDAMIQNVFQQWTEFREKGDMDLDSLFEGSFPGHQNPHCGLSLEILNIIDKAKQIMQTAQGVMDVLSFRRQLFRCPSGHELPPMKNHFPYRCEELTREDIVGGMDLTAKRGSMVVKKSPETVFFEYINWNLNEMRLPVALGLCSGFLLKDNSIDPDPSSRKTNIGKKAITVGPDGSTCTDDSAHYVLITGRRYNPETKECELRITNSWGKNCLRYHPDFQANCKDGEIYMEINTLLRNTTDISYLQ